MRMFSLRPMIGASVVVAAAGILGAGLALSPASAVVGPSSAGPDAAVTCTSGSPCQTYKNKGLGAGVEGINTKNSPFGSGVIGNATQAGIGVTGTSLNGFGVNGTSTNATGVSGTGATFGTFGYSGNGTGVEGQSSG